jgi:hypothetical protein
VVAYQRAAARCRPAQGQREQHYSQNLNYQRNLHDQAPERLARHEIPLRRRPEPGGRHAQALAPHLEHVQQDERQKQAK